AFERSGHAVGGVLDVLWSIPAAVRANRALLAGVLALAVAGLAFTVSSGGFGVVEASRAVPAQPSGPGPGEEGPGAPSSEEPVPSGDLLPSEELPPSEGPPSGEAP